MEVEGGDERRVGFAAVDVYPRHISCYFNNFDGNLALNDARQRLIEAVNVEARKDAENNGREMRPSLSSNLSKAV
jgi:hypothetical protein